MFRLLRTILCITSLLLFLAIALMWASARSAPVGLWYKHTNVDLFQEYINTSNYYFFTIQENKIQLGHWRDPKLVLSMKQGLGQKQSLPPTIVRALMARGALPNQPALITPYFSAPAGFLLPDGLHSGVQPRNPWPIDPDHTWSRMGISFEHQVASELLIRRLILPVWLPLLLLGAPPFLRARKLYKRYRQRHLTLCPCCGYDLRATPNLCPECGHAVKIAAHPQNCVPSPLPAAK